MGHVETVKHFYFYSNVNKNIFFTCGWEIVKLFFSFYTKKSIKNTQIILIFNHYE